MMKLDLRKAYGTVDWDFLEEMLKCLGFPNFFINLVMICVKTPKICLMLNSYKAHQVSKRVKTRGSPISPSFYSLHGVLL